MSTTRPPTYMGRCDARTLKDEGAVYVGLCQTVRELGGWLYCQESEGEPFVKLHPETGETKDVPPDVDGVPVRRSNADFAVVWWR